MRHLSGILLILVLAIGGPVSAQTTGHTYESLTIAATAVGITAAIRSPAGRPQNNHCVGRLETGQVRLLWGAQDPTATEGILVEIGDIVTLENHRDARFVRFIRTGVTSGVLKIQCWLQPSTRGFP